MDADHIAPSRSETDRLRRYVLDSLAAGQTIAVHCSDRSAAQGFIALGTRFGAQSVATRSANGWQIQITSGPGSLDLYTIH